MTDFREAPTDHPELERPLLIEALLEIRFTGEPKQYGFVPGRLLEHLKSHYPNSVDLFQGNVPLELAPPELVRHRFTSIDGKSLVQTGTGVFTVNRLRPYKFKLFKQQVEFALVCAESISLFPSVDRIGLRYINQAPIDRDWHDIVAVNVSGPAGFGPSAVSQRHQWVTSFPNTGLLSTTIAWPRHNPNMGTEELMLIDLDHFVEPHAHMDSTDILAWLTSAHENVYRVFKSCLQPKYWSYLQGDGK